jgi:tripartite-type tricarboxylate transporter receptor subunit TctC
MNDFIDSRCLAIALCAAWLAQPLVAAAADPVKDYPSKPIRFIAPFVAGAGTDTTARSIAAKLAEAWGQQVVVDNRTGAAGAIGVELTAQAVPDGYTICLISASHAVNSATNPKLPYNLEKDLQAIAQATSLFYVVSVVPTVPAKTVKELIAYAKANPNKLNFGSSGTGGLQHMAGEMFNYLAGVKMVHVPYKGAAGIAEAMKAPDVLQRLAADGSTPVGSTPEQFGAHIKSEIAKWRKLVKEARIELHQ